MNEKETKGTKDLKTNSTVKMPIKVSRKIGKEVMVLLLGDSI